MSYAVRKAGIPFKVKVETSADLSGIAAGFTAYYINDADGVRTDISGAFSEDVNAAGLYFSPEVTIPAAGDFTVVMSNATVGMDNHPTPIVVTTASIDDIKEAVDDLRVVTDAIALDVEGLDGTDLQSIRDNLTAIKTLIDDQDGTAVNSVMEFVAQIDAALLNGSSGLAALAGYTDDVENMLLGTEFLADGVTANPLFGANNADIKALIEANLIQLQGDIAAAQTSIETKIGDAQAVIEAKVAEVKTVVDANAVKLGDAGYGLEALKLLIDGLASDVANGENDILAVLNDATKGLVGIYDTMVSRFDNLDNAVATVDSKLDSIGGAQGFRAFV